MISVCKIIELRSDRRNRTVSGLKMNGVRFLQKDRRVGLLNHGITLGSWEWVAIDISINS